MEYLTATAISPNVHVAIFTERLEKSSHPQTAGIRLNKSQLPRCPKVETSTMATWGKVVKNSWQVSF